MEENIVFKRQRKKKIFISKKYVFYRKIYVSFVLPTKCKKVTKQSKQLKQTMTIKLEGENRIREYIQNIAE